MLALPLFPRPLLLPNTLLILPTTSPRISFYQLISGSTIFISPPLGSSSLRQYPQESLVHDIENEYKPAIVPANILSLRVFIAKCSLSLPTLPYLLLICLLISQIFEQLPFAKPCAGN